jgi:hypothetical protein
MYKYLCISGQDCDDGPISDVGSSYDVGWTKREPTGPPMNMDGHVRDACFPRAFLIQSIAGQGVATLLLRLIATGE